MNQKLRIIPVAMALSGILAAGAVIAGGHPESDRKGHSGPPSAERQVARLEHALDLSDQQSAELLTILQAAEEERQAMHQRVMEQLRPEVCAQMQATHEEILDVLTPEQAEEFDQMMAERKDRFHDRSHRGGMPDFNCDELES